MKIFNMLDNLSAIVGILTVIPYLENDSMTVKFVDGTTAIVRPNSSAMDVYDEEGFFVRTDELERSDEAILSKISGMASHASLASRKF
jgi:hypothetical protein